MSGGEIDEEFSGIFAGSTSMAKLILKSSYDVQKVTSSWPDGNSVPYAFLCDAFADVSNVSARLECILRMAHCFHAILHRSPDSLREAVYLTLNKLAPDQEGLELGVGDAILTKAVADGCCRTVAYIKEQYQKTGDLAEVAQTSKQGQKMLMQPKPLTVARVFSSLKYIATASGKDAQKQRSERITLLLREAKGVEVNFIVRALQGKMRMGLAELSVLVALSYAFFFHFFPEYTSFGAEALQARLNAVAEGLRRAYHDVPSLDVILPRLLQEGLAALQPGSISITPGVAVKPMLAHPTNGISTIFERLEGKAFTCEYKYDGERAQLHFVRNSVDNSPVMHIFSRNLENNTSKYPDIIQLLPTCVSKEVNSFIIDSEVVAVDVKTGDLKSFQVLQHRARKDVKQSDIIIPVCVFAFDLLYLNGEPLLHLSLAERRENLFASKLFEEHLPEFRFVQHEDCHTTEAVETFFQKALDDGCEGLMIKTLTKNAEYVPSKRSHSWLKLKKDYLEGMVDTMDLIPIGAYFGKGKRAGVFGGFLLACYDKETEHMQTACKLGTGFSDTELENLTEQLKEYVIDVPRPYYQYDEKDEPDAWVADHMVWEIKAADLSISPRHYAAYDKVADGKGIALRFPRFIKVREDKGPSDATDSVQIASMYRAQNLAMVRSPAEPE